MTIRLIGVEGRTPEKATMLSALLLGSLGLLGDTAATGTKRQAQACTGALVIDDFSRWDAGENSLAGATSGKSAQQPLEATCY